LPTAQVLLFSKDRSPGNVGRACPAYRLPIAVGCGGLTGLAGRARRVAPPAGAQFGSACPSPGRGESQAE